MVMGLLVLSAGAAWFIHYPVGGRIDSDLGWHRVEEVALAKTVRCQTLLEEGVKKEGKLLWYRTLIVNQALKEAL